MAAIGPAFIPEPVRAALAPLVREVEVAARAAGVELSASVDDCEIIVDDLRRVSAPPGTASAYLRRLSALADRYAVPIFLVAHESAPKLVAYYERHGYRAHYALSPLGTEMLRPPRPIGADQP